MSANNRGLITHELTIPAGPIGAKYRDFVHNEQFKEMAFVGTFNTTKSTALVDWLILSGIEYPGANLVLTRAKLSDLRRTTLTKYLSRAGKVLVDDYNKNEALIEFPEINGERSKLYMFGLDRVDLDEVLKSFEPFRAAVEEANEVPSRALDLLLGRLRQKVPHRSRSWAHYIDEMASMWGCSFERAREVLGIAQEQLHMPHYGRNQLKYVFNPEGNDHIWKRCVGIPYPNKEEMGPEWVKRNVGIREFVVPAKDIGSYQYQAGNLVGLRDGSRGFVAREKPGGTVELVDGREIRRAECDFIGQRAAIFAFTQENWSRNIQSDENFLYMQDPAIREQYFEAKIDTRKGLVLPQFDRKIHVAPPLKGKIPPGIRILLGVDQGFRHPTVALVAAETRKPVGGLFIFKEYIASGRSAAENAYIIKGMVPPEAADVLYWADPSMWKTDPTSLKSVASEYLEAGIPLMRAENNIEWTIDAIREMLNPQMDWTTGDSMARLFISEECERLIHAIETITSQHMVSSRDNWAVDVIDALRYLVAGAIKGVHMAPGGSYEPKPHVKTWGWAN